MEDHHHHHNVSPRRKKPKHSFCLAGCFRNKTHVKLNVVDAPEPKLHRSASASSAASQTSPSSWLKSRSCYFSKSSRVVNSHNHHHHHRPDSGDSPGKFMNFVSRMNRHRRNNSYSHPSCLLRHRRRSADFHYDASSYALNFDEGDDLELLDEYPLRSFVSRLPASPPEIEATTAGMTACSC